MGVITKYQLGQHKTCSHIEELEKIATFLFVMFSHPPSEWPLIKFAADINIISLQSKCSVLIVCIFKAGALKPKFNQMKYKIMCE